jgi:hypothetical protein
VIDVVALEKEQVKKKVLEYLLDPAQYPMVILKGSSRGAGGRRGVDGLTHLAHLALGDAIFNITLDENEFGNGRRLDGMDVLGYLDADTDIGVAGMCTCGGACRDGGEWNHYQKGMRTILKRGVPGGEVFLELFCPESGEVVHRVNGCCKPGMRYGMTVFITHRGR